MARKIGKEDERALQHADQVDSVRMIAIDLRRDLAEKGLRQSRRFSWTQTAREMLAVYHRAAGVAATSTTVPPSLPASERPVAVKSMSRERSL